MGNPLGGVARRQAYIELFRRYYENFPYIHVDSGSYFADKKDSSRKHLTEESLTRNLWVVRAFNRMGLDALNVSFHDLDQLVVFSDRRIADQKLPDCFTSANIIARDQHLIRPAPFIVRELKGGRLKKRSLRIGIIGLTATPGNQPEGYQIEDPISAAARVLPSMRERADYIVVLAYMSNDAIEKLVHENPYIDVVIGNLGALVSTQVKTIGRTLVTYSVHETRFLGEIRIYIDDDGRPAKSVNRYIALNATIPDDPAIERLRVEARKQIGTSK